MDKGFLQRLFDTSFEELITQKVVRVVYIIWMALVGLGALAYLFIGLSAGGAIAFLTLIFVPIAALIYLVMVRLTLELLVVLHRMSDDIHEMKMAAVPVADDGDSEPGGRTD